MNLTELESALQQAEGRLSMAAYSTICRRIAALEAEVARYRQALHFYADQLRYEGPNQRALPGDAYSVGKHYRHDVTKDNGDIARAALKPETKEG
jgi:hypothetical protein